MSDLKTSILGRTAAAGIAVNDAAAGLMAKHVQMVYESNAEFNLTRIDLEDAATQHVLDSLLAARSLELCPEGPLADLGSGAGFPGIPLAILSGRPVTLVESVKKKAAFLERAVAALRLNSAVRAVRAEELALSEPEAFAVVVARALTALPSLVELAAPLLRPEGVLIAMKGQPEPDELERGRAAARLCGMAEIGVEHVSAPGFDVTRTLVLYRKTGRPARALPRRPGMAQRQPLA